MARSRSSVRLAFALAGLLAVSSLPAAPAALAQALPQAPSERPDSKSAEEAKKREEEERKAREARAKEIRHRVDVLKGLIKEVNGALQLRTAGNDTFDRKRVLENQLRDYITLLSLTDQALAEAERLAQEAEAMRKSAGAGPRDSQRLQLVNFLEARRREYILFGTR